jgi:hypothetical protein
MSKERLQSLGSPYAMDVGRGKESASSFLKQP